MQKVITCIFCTYGCSFWENGKLAKMEIIIEARKTGAMCWLCLMNLA